jgi:hypothetical protein
MDASDALAPIKFDQLEHILARSQDGIPDLQRLIHGEMSLLVPIVSRMECAKQTASRFNIALVIVNRFIEESPFLGPSLMQTIPIAQPFPNSHCFAETSRTRLRSFFD